MDLLPHPGMRHQGEITEQTHSAKDQPPAWETHDIANKKNAQNPDWEQQEQHPDQEEQKRIQEKNEHTFVKIQKDKRHKTTENEWLPFENNTVIPPILRRL